MGLKWLVFIVGPLFFIGVWIGEEQRTYILKTHVLREIGLLLQYY